MIDLNKLTNKDIGRFVLFIGFPGQRMLGRIKSWIDPFIFVVYNCDNRWDDYRDFTAEATSQELLVFVEDA